MSLVAFDLNMECSSLRWLDETLTHESPLAVDGGRVVPHVGGARVGIDVAPEGDAVPGLSGAVLRSGEKDGRV